MKSLTCILFILPILFGCATTDGGSLPIQAGDVELEVSGTVQNFQNDDIDDNMAQLSGRGFYVITPVFEAGLLLSGEFHNSEDPEGDKTESRMFLFGPDVRFNFPLSNTVIPFIDMAAGFSGAHTKKEFVDGDESSGGDSEFFYRGGLGSRFYVQEKTYLLLEAFYENAQLDPTSGGDTDRFGLQLGLGTTF